MVLNENFNMVAAAFLDFVGFWRMYVCMYMSSDG